jgi:Na+/H+ antiporter NhaD/arsenite permease-like protein
MIKWVVLGIAVLMYALIVAFPGKKSFAALGAALLMLVLQVVSPVIALGELVNWDVLMIFIGSLAIAELFIYSRVPAVIADNIVEHSPNVGIAIVAILMMTGIISAFVENVATVLVMAPIALALCNKLKMDNTYFMAGLAVMANIQGTATLVGDPPSMIFADFVSTHIDPSFGFNEFFVYQGKLSIFFAVQAGMIAGALFLYAFFASKGKKKVSIEKEKALSMFPSILLLLMIGGLAGFSFFFGGISVWSGLLVMALDVAGIIWYGVARREGRAKVWKLVKGLDWDTALFLVGIFIVVGAVSEVGLLDDFAVLLGGITGGSVIKGFIIIVAVSVLISGFVDNVPYIIVMLPVVAKLAESGGFAPELFMFALLIGSCMGGNLTPFGASANIVVIGIVNRDRPKNPVTFPQWLKVGAPFTILTTAAASLFVWFVWR